MTTDPFPLTPPTAAERAQVDDAVALLSAAADRLERLVADGSPLPWRWVDPGGKVKQALASGSWPNERTVVPSANGDVYPSAVDADLIVALVNAGPALVVWLRSAARDATEVGPDDRGGGGVGVIERLRADLETRIAEQRWRAINAAKRAAGCPCGRAATQVARFDEVTGSVPAETWTCAEHVGVSSWAGITGQPLTPYWPRPQPCVSCEGRCMTTGKIDRPHIWHCPIKPGGEGER